MVNNSASPHTVHGTMPIYSNNGGTWTLMQGDYVALHLEIERTEAYPNGQMVELGYIRDGEMVMFDRDRHTGAFSCYYPIKGAGEYHFYLRNNSFSTLYVTSFTVEIMHPENYENIHFGPGFEEQY